MCVRPFGQQEKYKKALHLKRCKFSTYDIKKIYLLSPLVFHLRRITSFSCKVHENNMPSNELQVDPFCTNKTVPGKVATICRKYYMKLSSRFCSFVCCPVVLSLLGMISPEMLPRRYHHAPPLSPSHAQQCGTYF